MDEIRPKRRRRRLLWLGVAAALVGLAWSGSRAVGYALGHRVVLVPSGSMAPAILPGDRLLIGPGGGSPGRGEIWTIAGPNAAMLIKRVVGLPGETIEVRDGRAWVDGKALPEPYLTSPTGSNMPPIALGPDEYFLMGDARATSLDSRAWGPVHLGRFLGRAEHRIWPSSRMGAMR